MAAEELAFAGVAGQRAALRAGKVTPRELVEMSLARIGRLDPELNAFRRVFGERALCEADQALDRLRDGDLRPLRGIPVAIKDNVDVAGDVTTHGTGAYGADAATDCEAVRRVREAGAIVVGRTHVPPLCAMACTESAAWGVTRNPWDPSRTPGGSSGGSAAAVAAGLVPFALGSDGAGSIRIPAAFCGLFGLKPQRGRISLAPMAEHWHGMTSIGWLTRTVRDAAIVYDATQGSTDRDADRPLPPERSFTAAADRGPGRLRIAWSVTLPLPARAMTRVDPRVVAAVRETAALLGGLGHDVAERTPDYPELLPLAATARILAGVAEDISALPHPRRLERRFRRVGAVGALFDGPPVARARAAEASLSSRLGAIFDDVDVLVCPVIPSVPFDTGRWEGRGWSRLLAGSTPLIAFTSPWNFTGQPAAAVPAGFTDDGLPLAIQLVGRPNDEPTLFSLAAQLERARPWPERRPPNF
jgi:amidase